MLLDGREIVFSGFKSGIIPITTVEGTGRPDMLDRVAYICCVAKVSDHKIFDDEDRLHLKILTLK